MERRLTAPRWSLEAQSLSSTSSFFAELDPRLISIHTTLFSKDSSR